MLKQLISNRKPECYGKVAVLLGGSSAERNVSLLSGNAIYEGLINAGIDAIKLDPVDSLYESLMKEKVSRAFIALHGRDGEDGVIQGFLKSIGIPFSGSDVTGSSISMDKMLSKQIFQQVDIPTATFFVVNRHDNFSNNDARKLLKQNNSVLFVKPVKEGSSVGMSKVQTPQELVDAVALAHQYDSNALIERFISGKEYTVSIIKGHALPSISMQTPREFYDYEAKYTAKTTEYFCPSDLTEEEEVKIAFLAKKAFKALGCSGWGRVDFIRDGDNGDFLILEVNTVPGMTQSSLVPKAAKVVGINFQQLVLNILDTSFDNEGDCYAKNGC